MRSIVIKAPKPTANARREVDVCDSIVYILLLGAQNTGTKVFDDMMEIWINGMY